MTDQTFYSVFSDRHRGSRELIRSRLEADYLSFIEPLHQLYPGGNALDLGCGRGEWLELLREKGFAPHGIDLDEGMLSACRDRGFSVAQQDAATALTSLAAESQAIVSAFHLVEHLPQEVLQTLVQEALRVLKPGGLLILETPNPENILVSTSSFFFDPTHQRPIPLHLLAFIAEYHGFARVKVLRLHEPSELAGKETISLLDVLGGVSPDYAIVAQKKGTDEQLALTGPPFAVDRGLHLEGLTAQYERQTESRLATAQSRLTAVESRLELAESRIATAESRARDAELALEALYHSRSWRLTRPLRFLTDLLRRLRGGPAGGGPDQADADLPLSPSARGIKEELRAAMDHGDRKEEG